MQSYFEEGFETMVLSGMHDLLASGRILNMIIEVTPSHWEAAGVSIAEGVDEMVKLTDQ